MRSPSLLLSLALLLTLALAACAGDDGAQVCDHGVTQTCICADGRRGAQECNESLSGWNPCVCTYVIT